jgi:hypothetical protein
MRSRRWYSPFGIEPPFPWLGIALFVCAAVIAEAAVAHVVIEIADGRLADY